jgi:hypothetical protein
VPRFFVIINKMYGQIRLSESVKLCSLKYLPVTVFNYPNIHAVIVAKHGKTCDNLTRAEEGSEIYLWRFQDPGGRMRYQDATKRQTSSAS